MFRAILPDGTIGAKRYEKTDHGVELYTKDDVMKAFVPYENLVALTNEDVIGEPDRSIL